MNDFNTMFPNFAQDCAQLRDVVTPIAFVLLSVGVVSSAAVGQRSPSAYLRTIARTLAYVAVLALLTVWGNEITERVDYTVRNVLHVDPSQVHTQYQQALQAEGSSSGEHSWWDNLFDGEGLFESLISVVLLGIGMLAGTIVFYAYLVQKFILFLGYALSPFFIGFLGVRTLHSIGVSFLLGLVGVMLWPLGWGLAGIVTKGLIEFMADQSFLVSGGASGAVGYTLQNLLGLAALGLWIIFSTIAAPVLLQKAITTGTQIGQALASGTLTAAAAGVTNAMSGAAVGSAGGGVGGALAGVGIGGVSGGVATAESASTGSTYSPLASALNSLGGMRGKTSQSEEDPTRDKEVKRLLQTA